MKLIHNRTSSRPSHQRVLAVEAGQVMCPRRGVVDIEDCWVCPAYQGMGGGPLEGLVCSTRPVVMPSAMGSRIV
jgi:hypothetical protein